METTLKISQAVSVIPVIVAIVVLYVGGSAGSWFVVEEFYQYSATDEDASKLVDYSDYNYYLNEVNNVEYTGPDKTGMRLELTLPYSSDGYENRATTFYNLGLVLYATMFIALICSFLLINREETKGASLYKYIYGALSLSTLILAEILVRYSGLSYYYTLIYFLFPVIFIPILYLEIVRRFMFENLRK